MAKWWNKAVGEISKLRSSMWGVTAGLFNSSYTLNSTKVDYAKAKALYYNENDDYKLGAAFAKPIINNTVSFMGIPDFLSVDKGAQESLTSFFSDNKSKMQKTHRNMTRDGDCYVWITREENRDASLYPEQETRLVYNIIPAEQVIGINLDPITNGVTEYILRSKHEWIDDTGNKKNATITQRIGIGTRTIEIEGDTPPDIEAGVHPMPWDFIPIVHFKNEGDDGIYGQSDLEPVEPFLKAYHDIMLDAMKGSKMHSIPKLKLRLKSVDSFLKNNFGVTDPAEFAKEGGVLDLSGHELLVMEAEDNAEFIEVRSATGDAQVLLKLLFYCIVDVSEMPEFVFGVHTPSSQASVKEQMPVLISSIERKREQVTDYWQYLARIVLAMTAQAENESFETYATKLSWEVIDPRSGNEIAQELKLIVEAITIALNNNLMGEESAVNFLSKYIETMNEWESEEGESEQERITKSRINRMRSPDSESFEKELAEIKKVLSKESA